jgi:hypothetical protein
MINYVIPLPFQTRMGINVDDNVEITGGTTVRAGISFVSYSKACSGFNTWRYIKGNMPAILYLPLAITLQAGLFNYFPLPFASFGLGEGKLLIAECRL